MARLSQVYEQYHGDPKNNAPRPPRWDPPAEDFPRKGPTALRDQYLTTRGAPPPGTTMVSSPPLPGSPERPEVRRSRPHSADGRAPATRTRRLGPHAMAPMLQCSKP